MSVRATERLIGDIVIATGLPNSPLMIVQDINEEDKMITTSWFSDSHEYQEGFFPASSLDRAEPREAPKKEKKAVPGRRGRKPAAK